MTFELLPISEIYDNNINRLKKQTKKLGLLHTFTLRGKLLTLATEPHSKGVYVCRFLLALCRLKSHFNLLDNP